MSHIYLELYSTYQGKRSGRGSTTYYRYSSTVARPTYVYSSTRAPGWAALTFAYVLYHGKYYGSRGYYSRAV